MTADVIARSCKSHPDRPGAAACMACGAVVCHECTTTWEGINHCPPCLLAKASATRQGSGVLSWIGVVVACALLLAIAAELAVSTGVLIFGE